MGYPDLNKLFFEPGLLVPGVKPIGNVEVDWSLSITRGLKFDSLLDGNPDIVGNKPLTLNGDATWQVGQAGKCLNCTISDDWAGTPNHPDFQSANNNNGFTWIFLAELPDVATNTVRTILGRGSELPGVRVIRITKENNNTDEFQFLTGDSGGSWSQSLTTFTTGITYDKPFFLAGKVDDRSGSPVKNLFLDGQKSSDMGNAFNEYVDVDQEWRLGIGQVSADYVGNIYRSIFFNRPLEDYEIEQIRLDPYQYLKPANIFIPFPEAVGPVNYERTLSEAITSQDNLAAEALHYRQLLSSIDAIDTIIRTIQGVVLDRTLSDSLDVTDNLSIEALHNRALFEALATNDNVLIETLKNRLLSDSVDTLDSIISIIQGVILDRTLSDSLSVSDAIKIEALHDRVLADSITANDSLLVEALHYRSLIDSIDALDSLTRSVFGGLVIERTLSDSVEVVDLDERYIIALRALVESLTTTDLIGRDTELFRLLQDNIEIADAIIRTITLGGVTIIERTLQDNININDLLNRSLELYRRFAETTGVSDELRVQEEIFRKLFSAIDTTDALIRSVFAGLVIERNLSDSIDITDSLFRTTMLVRLLHEDITTYDQLIKTLTSASTAIGFIKMALNIDKIHGTANYQIDAGEVIVPCDSLTGLSISAGNTIELSTDNVRSESGLDYCIKAILGSAEVNEGFLTSTNLAGSPLDWSDVETFGWWFYLPAGEAAKIDSVGWTLNIYIDPSSTGDHYYNYRPFSPTIAKDGWNFMAVIKGDENASFGDAAINNYTTVYKVGMDLRKAAGDILTVYIGPMMIDYKSRPKLLMNFDDGADDGYWAYQQMGGLKGTLFIPGDVIDSDGGVNFLTAAEVDTLYAAGWDVGGHGGDGFNTMTLAQIETLLDENLTIFQAGGWVRGNEFFSYPLGQIDSIAGDDYLLGVIPLLASKGIVACRSSADKLNYPAPYGIDDPYRLRTRALGQGAGDSLVADATEALVAIDECINAGATLLLLGHKFVASSPSGSTEWLESEFLLLVAGIQSRVDQGLIDVETFTEWLAWMDATTGITTMEINEAPIEMGIRLFH